jgi:DNA-directed RNA polymerase
MTEEKKRGKAWRMREWGRAQYRNRQAKLRADGESSKTEASKRMLRVQAPKLGKKVEDFIDTFGGSTEHTTPLFLTFVLDMCPYQIASLALQTFLDNLQFNLPVGRMAYKIGKSFENQARWDKALDTMHPSKLDLLAMDDRSKAMKLKQFYDYEEERFTLWDSKCKAGLGAWLLEEIRIETGLWVMGFATGRQKGHKAERIVRATDDFTDWVSRFDSWKETTRVFKMALPEEPVDWYGLVGGGYSVKHMPPQKLFTSKPVSTFKPYKNSYLHVMSAVNNLQKTAWQINKDVLSITLKCWENKRVIGNIPNFGEIDEQPRYTGDCPHEFRAWKLKQKDIRSANESNSSKRYQTCRILHLAKVYSEWDKFYFPYRCDYRGRVYALPYYLHPQGSDLAKSLLDFSRGEQVVDEDDLMSILVHGANMWGVKGTRDERIEWVDKRKDFILEAASDPHGTDWWTEASDPFCFLRFCLEYKKFTAEGYGYVSYLPVRQDCSNNGMQILSLLLRDKNTGRMCNLVDNDKANDMYAEFADRVYDELKKDGGVLAHEWMKYGFSRKLAKLAVMNKPYGATHYNLVQDIFKSIGINHPWTSTGEMLTAVIWISKIVNKLANEMCRPVNQVMKFLRESVRALGYDKPITWTTPTGFKVIQSFHRYKKVNVESVFQNLSITIQANDFQDDIDPKGQTNAVTANFIHSLDACIVHQVANVVDFDACYIHDCFVTHACNARAMNAIVRRTYTKTFNVDLLTEFRMEQINTNPEAELPSVPELGDLDVSAITQMKYLLS